jgi:hypothetical protein
MHIRFDAKVAVTTTSGGGNAAGDITTAKQKLFDMNNKQIGVGQWMKIVTVNFFNFLHPFSFSFIFALVSIFPHLLLIVLYITQGSEEGFPGALNSMFTLIYEFGTSADGYYDSSITAVVAADRLPTEPTQRDYDAIITGGTGKINVKKQDNTCCKYIHIFRYH